MTLADGRALRARHLVNAAGAWADPDVKGWVAGRVCTGRAALPEGGGGGGGITPLFGTRTPTGEGPVA